MCSAIYSHHLSPIAVRAKGYDHTVLITDCMRAGGMPNGQYKLGDFPVVLKVELLV